MFSALTPDSVNSNLPQAGRTTENLQDAIAVNYIDADWEKIYESDFAHKIRTAG